jgi:hypothetical protein
VCCSVRCRQARHRFTRTVGQGVARGRPPRLAYADPPYPGNAHLYRGHRDYAGEVDHAALITHLTTYDGWALSTSAPALPAVLALCPPGVRVAAWHKGARTTPSRHPLNAWEPVLLSRRALDEDRPRPGTPTAHARQDTDYPETALRAALERAPDEGITVPHLVMATGMSRPTLYLRLNGGRCRVPLHVLSKIAGHGSLTTTQRYLHPDAQSIAKAGDALSVHLGTRQSPDGPRLRAV